MVDEKKRPTTVEELEALTLEERIAFVKQVAEEAKVNDTMTCKHGGEPVFHVPISPPLVPGHVDTDDGLREMRITGWCGYHWDMLLKPGWVDPLTGEHGHIPPEEGDEWDTPLVEPEGEEDEVDPHRNDSGFYGSVEKAIANYDSGKHLYPTTPRDH